MKKISYILLAMLFVFGSAVMCGATSISTSAAGSQFGDNYSYTFVITDDSLATTPDSTLFHATLTNTSTGGSDTLVTYDPLIDAFAFNIGTDTDVSMGDDFIIQNIAYTNNTSPPVIVNPANWLIAAPTGRGIKFDYVGNEGSGSDQRLHANEILTFDFNFADTFIFPSEPFDLWLQTNGSTGTGFGGGDINEDFGQVGVSFQRLGGDDENNGLDGSDLLASNWEGGADPQNIPEPATMLLIGSGLIGFAVSGKKRFKKRNG